MIADILLTKATLWMEQANQYKALSSKAIIISSHLGYLNLLDRHQKGHPDVKILQAMNVYPTP